MLILMFMIILHPQRCEITIISSFVLLLTIFNYSQHEEQQIAHTLAGKLLLENSEMSVAWYHISQRQKEEM